MVAKCTWLQHFWFLKVFETNSISLNVINICFRHNLNIKVVQIGKLIYMEFLGSKMAAP